MLSIAYLDAPAAGHEFPCATTISWDAGGCWWTGKAVVLCPQEGPLTFADGLGGVRAFPTSAIQSNDYLGATSASIHVAGSNLAPERVRRL